MNDPPPPELHATIKPVFAGGDDSDVAVAEDLRCLQCEYNLRGLRRGGRCPECGASITESLRGNLLRIADQKWLKSMLRGARLMVAALALKGLEYATFIFGIMVVGLGAYGLLRGFMWIQVLIEVAGVLLLTRREPQVASRNHLRWLGILARAGVTGSTILFVCDYFVPMSLIVFFVSKGMVGAGRCATVYFVARQSARIPAPALARFARFIAYVLLACAAVEIAMQATVHWILRFGTPRPSLLTWMILVAYALIGGALFAAAILYYKFARGVRRQLALAQQIET